MTQKVLLNTLTVFLFLCISSYGYAKPSSYRVIGKTKNLETTTAQPASLIWVRGGKNLRVKLNASGPYTIDIYRFYGKPQSSRRKGSVAIKSGKKILKTIRFGFPDPIEEDPFGLRKRKKWRVTKSESFTYESKKKYGMIQIKVDRILGWGVGIVINDLQATSPFTSNKQVALNNSNKEIPQYEEVTLINEHEQPYDGNTWYQLKGQQDFLYSCSGPEKLTLFYKQLIKDGDQQEKSINAALLLDEVLLEALSMPVQVDENAHIQDKPFKLTTTFQVQVKIPEGNHQLRFSLSDEGSIGGLVSYLKGERHSLISGKDAENDKQSNWNNVIDKIPTFNASYKESKKVGDSLVPGGMDFVNILNLHGELQLGLYGGINLTRPIGSTGPLGKISLAYMLRGKSFHFGFMLIPNYSYLTQKLRGSTQYGSIIEHELTWQQYGVSTGVEVGIHFGTIELLTFALAGAQYLQTIDTYQSVQHKDSMFTWHIGAGGGVQWRFLSMHTIALKVAYIYEPINGSVFKNAEFDGLHVEMGYIISF